MTNFVVFFLLSLFNVILGTVRTILTVKANKHVSAIINAVSFTFNNAIIKIITEQSYFVILTVTFITNIIGVYIADIILDKGKKDKLWKIEVTVNNEETANIISDCNQNDLSFNYVDAGKWTLFNFYCSTQDESKKAKSIVKKHDAKYCIMEISKKL